MIKSRICFLFLLLSLFVLSDCKKTSGYTSLGCWTSPNKPAGEKDHEIIPSVEGSDDDDLEGFYWDRANPVLMCARVAKRFGYLGFAVRDGGECRTSSDVLSVYKHNGQSEECQGGEGGHRAMDVYKITGDLPDDDDYEGDIILTKVQQVMSTPIHDQRTQRVSDTEVWDKADFTWPFHTIPYFIPPKLKNHQLAQKMLAGIKHWENRTCIRFIPRKGHRDWVQLVREENPKSRRCASNIGFMGRNQQMRLGDHCPAGSVIHEWGHSIGLWHTQSRLDRDQYVDIVWDNIVPGKSMQFLKTKHGRVDKFGIKYDYKSIMHYGKDFFGKISDDKSRVLTTIRTKDKKYQDEIGQRKELSKTDVEIVNTLYGCPDYPYMWHAKDWGACSSECGAGEQTRTIFCAKPDGKAVSSKNCRKSSDYPSRTRKCYGRKCRRCPRGWKKAGKLCYGLVKGLKTWQDARDYCLNKGSDLLTLRSNKELRVIRKFTRKHVLHTVFFWLGARYNFINGSFQSTSKAHLDYKPWAKGQPVPGLDCALLLDVGQGDHFATDSCKSKRHIICQIELQGYKPPNIKPKKSKKWHANDWSECSVTCGGGQRHRETYCAGHDKTDHVDNSKCTDEPPDAWEDCNTNECPSPYKWYVKGWGECSRSCGGGTRTRKVVCAKPDMLATAWDLCNHTKMPNYFKTCNKQPCPPSETLAKPEWKTSYWSRCSVTCGIGRQVRRAICMSPYKHIADKRCAGRPKPLLVKLCHTAKRCQRKTKQGTDTSRWFK